MDQHKVEQQGPLVYYDHLSLERLFDIRRFEFQVDQMDEETAKQNLKNFYKEITCMQEAAKVLLP